MVYVVERYLPGLAHSELLHGLCRLERAEEEQREPHTVRYLGSTIVLGDDACFCQFEGPSEAAVAEANREAGLPFDRIVPALTVTREGSTTMTVSPSIPSTVEMRRSRLLGLVAAVALVAAAITWVMVARVIESGPEAALGSAQAQASELTTIGPSGDAYLNSFTSPQASVQNARSIRSIMDLTPGDLAGGAWGYALPSRQGGPTSADILASMSPETRRYTEMIMNLTFEQLAAGAAGQP